jgi:hypothetical protein
VLRWWVLISATTSSSRAYSSTSRPATRILWASAVPHAPPPTMPKLAKRIAKRHDVAVRMIKGLPPPGALLIHTLLVCR